MNYFKVALGILICVWTLGMVSSPAAGYAGAQEAQLAVQITEVDSTAFPRVEAYVSVLDHNGLPVYGLTEAQWTVLEDGQGEKPSFSVRPDILQRLDLVLALDTSVEADALLQIKQAARDLIQTLDLDDRLGVVGFADEVKVLQTLTAPQDAWSAVEALTVTGQSTSLNEAVAEAINLLDASRTSRQAIVVLTDSPDNVGKLSLDAVLARIRAAGIPVYILGYGPKMARSGVSQLERLAQAAGGQFCVLLDSQSVRASLGALGSSFRQGYRITFHSRHPADGKAHRFSVRVSYGSASGQDQGEFIAHPAEVRVALLGLDNGQTVGGVVDLMAGVSAPSPVMSVTYWLNDELLGEATIPPYRVRWDSTPRSSHAYTLTAQALDLVGNKGMTSVRINVVHPISIVTLTVPSRLALGDELTVSAYVESLTELKQVEFFWDGRSIGVGKAVEQGRYELRVASQPYLPGGHLLAVRAYDRWGRMAERTQEVNLVMPVPSPTPAPTVAPRPMLLPLDTWWVGILSIVVVLLLTWLMLAMLFKWQRARRQGVFKLEIENNGNVPDQYELRAEVLGQVLNARFVLNGRELPRREVVKRAEIVESASAGEVRSTAGRGGPQGRPGGSPIGKVRKLARLGDLLADVVVSVAYLLPGTLRSNLLDWSRTFRRGRMAVDRVDYASSRLSESARAAGRVGGSSRTSQQSGRPVAGETSSRSRSPVIKPVEVISLWSQTPVVPAGESIAVQLIVTPVRLYQAGLYTFQIHSRSVEQGDAPPRVHGGEFFVPRVSWLFHILSVLVVTGATVSVALVLFWLKLV